MIRQYKYTVYALLAALLFSTTDVTAQTGSSVPAYQQEQSNWCWAACGSMLYWAYKPGTISQCAFVAVSRDNENSNLFDCNNLSSSTANPCTSPGTFNSPQSLYTCGGSIENVLDHYGISSTGYGNAFSATDLTNATHAKKHMVARWGWNSGGGHFVVIYRYSGGNVSYNNPAYGSSYTWTYNTFKTANNQATWTHTLRMDNAAVYGSVLTAAKRKDNAGLVAAAAPDLNFYPNPTTDRLNCIINNPAESGSQLVISNVMGQVIYRQQLDANTTTLSIDVSPWPRGTYIIQLNGAAGKKITVQ
jgi:hypothetical protein